MNSIEINNLNLNVKEGEIYGLDKKILENKKEFLIDKLNLNDYVNRLTGNLSGGWKRRLAFACEFFMNLEFYF